MTRNLILFFLSSIFLLEVKAGVCPGCGSDTFGDSSCINPDCVYSLPTHNNQTFGATGGADHTERLGKNQNSLLDSLATMQLSHHRPSPSMSLSNFAEDLKASEWIYQKKKQIDYKLLFGESGELSNELIEYIPNLSPILHEAQEAISSPAVILAEPQADKTLKDILKLKNQYLIIHYTYNSEPNHPGQIYLVQTRRDEQLYVLSDVPSYWNNITVINPQEFITEVLCDAFDPDSETITVYSLTDDEPHESENIDHQNPSQSDSDTLTPETPETPPPPEASNNRSHPLSMTRYLPAHSQPEMAGSKKPDQESDNPPPEDDTKQ